MDINSSISVKTYLYWIFCEENQYFVLFSEAVKDTITDARMS